MFKVNFQLNEEQSLRFGGVFYNNDFFANSYFQQRYLEYVHRQVRLQADRQRPRSTSASTAIATKSTMKYGTDATPNAGAPVTARARLGAASSTMKAGASTSPTSSRFHLGTVAVKSEYGYEYFSDDVIPTTVSSR